MGNQDSFKLKFPKPLKGALKNFTEADTTIHFKLIDKDGAEWYQSKVIDGKKVAIPFTGKLFRTKQ